MAHGADELSINSKITDARLWRANLGACVLHGVQGLLMLGASQGIPSVKAFKKDSGFIEDVKVKEEIRSSKVSQVIDAT